MFLKIDKKTKAEEVISDEAMVTILEDDLNADTVDEALTDMVTGTYDHRNRTHIFKYKS